MIRSGKWIGQRIISSLLQAYSSEQSNDPLSILPISMMSLNHTEIYTPSLAKILMHVYGHWAYLAIDTHQI